MHEHFTIIYIKKKNKYKPNPIDEYSLLMAKHSTLVDFKCLSQVWETSLEGYSDVHFSFNRTLNIYVTVDYCICYEAGNYYQPVSCDGCETFTQRTAYLPAQTQNCSESLLFDITICRCNYANLVSCPAYGQGTTTPLPTTTIPKSMCYSSYCLCSIKCDDSIWFYRLDLVLSYHDLKF